MSESTGEINQVQGLLPHEAVFLARGIRRALSRKRDADLEYGAAVASSGGDWAFDDMASVVAAFNAHLADQDLARMTRHSDRKTIDYPAPDSKVVELGSRIVLETDHWTDTYDLASRIIPELPVDSDHDVSLISAQAVLGAKLIGKCIGQTVVWEAPSGEITGTVVSIDQTAQRKFYETLINESFDN